MSSSKEMEVPREELRLEEHASYPETPPSYSVGSVDELKCIHLACAMSSPKTDMVLERQESGDPLAEFLDKLS